MSTGSESQSSTEFEDLSALVDGELQFDAVASACGRWRNEVASRSTWYAYQLIGDVLRSEDLASDASRDVAFLGALRARLATEPVVLAPQASLATTGGRPRDAGEARNPAWSWRSTSAVAAGFLAVAGVVTVLSTETPVTGSNVVAFVPKGTSAPASAGVQVSRVAIEAPPVMASGEMVRDAGLDRYLTAHKRFAGSSALGVPSQFLRSATVETSGR